MTKTSHWGATALAVASLCGTLALPVWAQTSSLAAAPSAPTETSTPTPAPAEASLQASPPLGHYCIDPSVAGARRHWQPEACVLPMISWPPDVDVPAGEARRLGSFQREPSAAEGVPGGFSRLPWHGYPAHNAPSSLFWH